MTRLDRVAHSLKWLLLLLLASVATGCGSDSNSPEKAITAYSLAGATGTINETGKTIAVTMPFGTSVTSLVATFSYAGAGVKIGPVTQTSGATTNDFTDPVVYTVIAFDNTKVDYTVTVTVSPSTAKAITSYSIAGVAGAINETAKTIAVTLPHGTGVTALVATFTTTGASVKVGAVAQTSGTTANDFTNPVAYTVTAGDGTTASYTVTVTVALSSAKAITAWSLAGVSGTISEAAKTIAVTLPFGTDVTSLIATFTTTGAGVKVGAAAQTSGTTANDFTNPVAYVVTAADGTTATYTVTVTVALSSAKAITAWSLAGVPGTINETAKTISVTMPFGTAVTSLVATFTTTGAGVKVGAVAQTSGTTANDFTSPVAYTVTASDGTTATYTVTVTVALSSAKALTAYALAGVAGTINEGAKTIAVTLPFGTNVTALVATFTTTGATVKVGATGQTSGTTANNFTSPVVYTVTAADGTTANYTVTATVALSSAKAITAWSLAGVAGTINEGAKTIAVTMPYGTNVTALVATFTTTGASVKVGAAVQTSGTTANNFTSPVAYLVTASDSTTATYTVTVTVAPNPAKAITAYSLEAVAGVINEGAKTIAVTLPFGTTVTALVATFTTTGATVKVGATVQTSGTTANDFTNPVAYLVTAADGTTATYTVTVSLAAATITPVPLGTAIGYAIFADTGIDTVPGASVITGNIGVGPGVTSTAITGFALNLPASSAFATSAQVSGNVYAFDYANPTPASVTTTSADMGTAYTDAASRTPTSAATTNVGAGTLTGLTLTPGVYEWGSAVTIPTDLSLSGNATDIWIFKVAGTLDMAAAKSVLLIGPVLPKNIFWQVAGAVTVGANTHFEGIILGKTAITFGNQASINGGLLAQTAVNLDATTVTQPAP